MNRNQKPGLPASVPAAALSAAFLLPLVALVLWSFAGRWSAGDAFPSHWSLRAFTEVIDGAARDSLYTSALVAVATAGVAVLVGVPAGIGFSRLSGRTAATARMLVLLPAVLPLLAYILGLQVLLVRAGWIESIPALILVHVLLAVPYVVLAVQAHAHRLDPDLELTARTLGARPRQVLLQVLVPQLRPSILLGAVLAFLVSWSDYVAALTIGTGGSPTLPVTLGALIVADDRAVSGAVALLVLAPVGAAVILARRFAAPALGAGR